MLAQLRTALHQVAPNRTHARIYIYIYIFIHIHTRIHIIAIIYFLTLFTFILQLYIFQPSLLYNSLHKQFLCNHMAAEYLPPSHWNDNQTTVLARYGYAILISTWLLFLITLNSFFHTWRFIIIPISGYELHQRLCWWFETMDDLVVKLWCIYVVGWWWAFVSWSGLKLFRHSKGIQSI